LSLFLLRSILPLVMTVYYAGAERCVLLIVAMTIGVGSRATIVLLDRRGWVRFFFLGGKIVV